MFTRLCNDLSSAWMWLRFDQADCMLPSPPTTSFSNCGNHLKEEWIFFTTKGMTQTVPGGSLAAKMFTTGKTSSVGKECGGKGSSRSRTKSRSPNAVRRKMAVCSHAGSPQKISAAPGSDFHWWFGFAPICDRCCHFCPTQPFRRV